MTVEKSRPSSTEENKGVSKAHTIAKSSYLDPFANFPVSTSELFLTIASAYDHSFEVVFENVNLEKLNPDQKNQFDKIAVDQFIAREGLIGVVKVLRMDDHFMQQELESDLAAKSERLKVGSDEHREFQSSTERGTICLWTKSFEAISAWSEEIKQYALYTAAAYHAGRADAETAGLRHLRIKDLAEQDAYTTAIAELRICRAVQSELKKK